MAEIIFEVKWILWDKIFRHPSYTCPHLPW